MSDIVVIARARARQGIEEEMEREYLSVIAPTHGEDGCVLYALHRDPEDRRNFVMIERWTSREALDAHLASPHIQRLFSALTRLAEGPTDISVLEPLTDETGEKGRL